VFISCGQDPEEKKVGLKIVEYFRKRGFDPYFAGEVQTPEALTRDIFESLKRSEYFISINFERSELNSGSLFVRQEFAIAAFLGIEMLAFHKGKDATLTGKGTGIGNYLVLKSIEFVSVKGLLKNLDKNTMHWDSNSVHGLKLEFGNYHSNVVVSNNPNGPLTNWIHVIVSNTSSKFYCKNCCAYVDEVVDLINKKVIIGKNDYKTELVWSGAGAFTINIPQGGKRDFDACYWAQGTNALVFHQLSMSTFYRYPNLNFGKYKIRYVIISENFPASKVEAIIEFRKTGISVLSFVQTE